MKQFKHFRSRDEMIDALTAKLKLTNKDILCWTNGKVTTITIKSVKKLDAFFERLDPYNVAASCMRSEDFDGGIIIIKSGISACIE